MKYIGNLALAFPQALLSVCMQFWDLEKTIMPLNKKQMSFQEENVECHGEQEKNRVFMLSFEWLTCSIIRKIL